MYDINSLLGVESEIIELHIRHAQNLRDEQVKTRAEQLHGNLLGDIGREAIERNQPLDPHIERLEELDRIRKEFKVFEVFYQDLSRDDREKFESRFEEFQEREFGEKGIDLAPSSPDHDKVQKELIGYGQEIKHEREQTDLSRKKSFAEPFIKGKDVEKDTSLGGQMKESGREITRPLSKSEDKISGGFNISGQEAARERAKRALEKIERRRRELKKGGQSL